MDLILVVGKDPLSNLYGFDGAYRADLKTYGTVVPDTFGGVLISTLTFDKVSGAIALKLPSAVYVTSVTITLDSGESVVLASAGGGLYNTGITPNIPFASKVASKAGGVQNMTLVGA